MSLTSLADGWGSLAWAVTWQLAALALLAWLVERLVRLRQPRARHALWWFVLAASLLLAPGRLVLERRQAVVKVAPPPPAARAMAEIPRYAAAPLLSPGDAPVVRAPADQPSAPAASLPPAPGPTVRVVDALALAWLLGCALLAIRLLIGHRRVRRILAESRPVEGADAADVLQSLRAEAGIRAPIGLRSSRSVGAPVLYGLRRPVIVVPQDFVDSLAPDEVQALLAHEVAHLRRRDVLANLAQRLIEIPLFFHPAAWLASRRITLSREELCDAWAVQRGADPTGYARWLTAAAERAYANGAAASLGVAERKFTLLRRVEAIMEVGNMKRMSRPLAVTTLTLLLAAASALAAVQWREESPRSTDLGAAEVTAVPPGEPFTPSQIEGLLQDAGVSVNRLSYEVPHAHRIRFTLEQYVDGKPSRRGSSSAVLFGDAGRNTMMLVLREREGRLGFSFKNEDGGVGVGAFSLEGYTSRTGGMLEGVQLAAGGQVPLFVYAANRAERGGIRSFDPAWPVEDIVAKYDMAIVVRAELQPTEDRQVQTPLPLGGTATLLGIAHHPVSDVGWWRTEGTPLPRPPHREPSWIPHVTGHEIALRISDVPDTVTAWTYAIPGCSIADVRRLKVRDGHVILRVVFQACRPKDVSKVTLRLGLAGGTWQTVLATKGEPAEIQHEVGKVILSRAERKDRTDAANMVVPGTEMTAIVPNAFDRAGQWEVAAVDQSGTVLYCPSAPFTDVSPDETGPRCEYRYHWDVPIHQIQEFRFRLRRFHFATFRDIPLSPRWSEGGPPLTRSAASAAG